MLHELDQLLSDCLKTPTFSPSVLLIIPVGFPSFFLLCRLFTRNVSIILRCVSPVFKLILKQVSPYLKKVQAHVVFFHNNDKKVKIVLGSSIYSTLKYKLVMIIISQIVLSSLKLWSISCQQGSTHRHIIFHISNTTHHSV